MDNRGYQRAEGRGNQFVRRQEENGACGGANPRKAGCAECRKRGIADKKILRMMNKDCGTLRRVTRASVALLGGQDGGLGGAKVGESKGVPATWELMARIKEKSSWTVGVGRGGCCKGGGVSTKGENGGRVRGGEEKGNSGDRLLIWWEHELLHEVARGPCDRQDS
ncbi:hypothetical protein BS47DRAFT_1362097 [Hydnum rufescens UP504]|uniref:Uncharacterized protein n=1 Tax=Hydnum rufescens UP504 TaxID=1448309 RepID=A0A9P6DT28_9AGAM|nr:hypothetical protein BS47DRAFT_1362097 [Hydnum rufescens UP504]